ncbi:hypothetical protein B9Z65_5862 [Elsinoe australis]|uniref:Uncharacterized protein n=1 Tax=Elsinoe australis TaxID=40998 RepID=A0A2P7YJC5_9PEZI|nr:hypothetical protein B9Z65_5862 [Elsinoe australis]
MASHQSFLSRRLNARQPPFLTTPGPGNIQHIDAAHDSPYSPGVLSAPFSPGLPASPLVATHPGPSSPMAARPYQPQQWANSGPVGGSYMPFNDSSGGPTRLTVDATGMESSLPSPPPPYHSPSPTTARTFLSNPGTPSGPLSPALGLSTDTSGRHSAGNSPQMTSQPQFPPPPGTNRTSNRHSPRNLLSLSRLTSRTNEGEIRAPLSIQTNMSQDPPGSRRAHSTGTIGLAGPSTNRNQLMHSPPQAQSSWQLGMPVPPPPPGPPPVGARSQSSGRLPDHPGGLSSHPTRGAAPPTRFEAAPLSPVPPTPSDYVDEAGDLTFGSTAAHPRQRLPSVAPEDRSISLTRRRAHREVSVEGIRDRRSKSRAAREGTLIDLSNQDDESESSGSGSANSRPANLIIRNSNNPRPADTSQRTTQSLPSSASQNTPDRNVPRPRAGMPTPPYTPASQARNTPGSSNRPNNAQAYALRDMDPSTESIRSATPSRNQDEEDAFINASLERFLEFGQQESAAVSDEERLLLFAKFVVDESRIRRDRYSSAFSKVASDLYDVTRDMWRRSNLEPPSTTTSNAMSSRDQSVDSGLESRAQSSAAMHSSAPSESELTPATDTESFCSVLERDQGTANQSPWNDRFKPSLSPIPSMTVSTYQGDEADSRGRSASRWWEASDNGSSGVGDRRLERSKQEIKYMSLHPSVMQQALEQQQTSSTSTPNDSDSTTRASAELSSYPIEKTGWHDELPTAAGPSRSSSFAAGKRPLSSIPSLPPTSPPLDVSRLVTLPPPYPRHYPAVNNNHPHLEAPRRLQRSLADLSLLRTLYTAHDAAATALVASNSTAQQARVRAFRAAVQADIDAGRVSHGMAMEADRRFRAHEGEKSLAFAQAARERFLGEVYAPGKEMLGEKLREAEVVNADITGRLGEGLSGGEASERAQVGGDEEPEVLEQLTLLKWVFEAREGVEREVFELEMRGRREERGVEKLGKVWRGMGRGEREEDERRWVRGVGDGKERWARESKERFEELRRTVERHVTRGVEAQLSAFWDVAPQLAEVVQRVPFPRSFGHGEVEDEERDLAELDDQLKHLPILIPPAELSENMELRRFPARYLYTTLTHARNSTRQFVDAQINLLCLLHEIQTAAMAAEVREVEVQRVVAGEDGEEVGKEMKAAREGEEARLTGELKGKVQEVEAGWDEALGGAVDKARAVVRGFLERCGGWEEGLDE